MSRKSKADPAPAPEEDLDTKADEAEVLVQADPAPAPEVKRFKVTENCRYVINGQIHTWPLGLVIDDLNYDIADVRAQGIPLAPATIEDIDTTPAIGHRAC